jgi:hypothetical protein
MKTTYDTYLPVELSKRYVKALKELLAAMVEMMQAADDKSVEFQYGAKEDLPDDGLGRFAVVVA